MRTFLLACSMLLLSIATLAAQPLPPEPPPIEREEPAAPTIEQPTDDVPPAEETPPAAEAPAEQPERSQPLLTGELPWADTVKTTKKLPAQRLLNARQMLEMFGIDDSQWYRLEDGRPLVESENELLYKILFRLPRFLLEDIERWQHHAANWDEVSERIEETRSETYLIKGTALKAEKIDLIPELATIYELRHYYRVTIAEAGDPARHMIVYTRQIPDVWPLAEPIEQRVQASGILLKVGAPPEDNPAVPAPLIFAAQRISWFPQLANPDFNVTPDRKLLASFGMDLGLFDDVTQRTGIGSRERECFYQMLAAVRHAPYGELGAEPGSETEAKPVVRPISEVDGLFATPDQEIGELKTFVGTARRITKVECDPDIRRRLGLSHYYQIDVFIPLKNEQIRLGRKEDTPEGEEAPVFTNTFPFTLCVAKLPKGLKETQEMNEQIRFTAFFFKLWTYKTVYMNQFGKEKKQIGPMLIGKDFQLVAPPTWPWRPYLGGIFGVLFLVGLGGVWLSLWRNTVADAEFQRTTLSKSYEVPGGKSLNEVGIEASGEPDFSRWGEREKEPE